MGRRLSSKLGSYHNGWRAFVAVFKQRFSTLEWEEKKFWAPTPNYDRRDDGRLIGRHNGKVVVELGWTLDVGGLYLTVSSDHFNGGEDSFGKVLCNRPLNPHLASNYITAAAHRRRKPKYKQEACKIAKQLFSNWQKNCLQS